MRGHARSAQGHRYPRQSDRKQVTPGFEDDNFWLLRGEAGKGFRFRLRPSVTRTIHMIAVVQDLHTKTDLFFGGGLKMSVGGQMGLTHRQSYSRQSDRRCMGMVFD